jgi:hypothetical protein
MIMNQTNKGDILQKKGMTGYKTGALYSEVQASYITTP